MANSKSQLDMANSKSQLDQESAQRLANNVSNPLAEDRSDTKKALFPGLNQARPVGFEPTTLGSEDRCAIQLRHGRVLVS